MNIHISEQTEARLTEEAQRQGVSVDVYIARLMNERGGSTQNKPESQKRDQPGSSIGQPTTLTRF